MKVLFLDFDGVLNSKQHLLAVKNIKPRGEPETEAAEHFVMKTGTNANNMWVLGYILKQIPDLKIVISSAWRLHYDTHQFKRLFKFHGLDGQRIIDKTPTKFSSNRCHEVASWLSDYIEENKENVDWITLDDHEIFELDGPERKFGFEYTTDSWVGLTMRDAFIVIKHFDDKYLRPYFGI